MCTYNIQIEDSLVARVRSNFSDEKSMERWMQEAIIMQLHKLAAEQEKRSHMETFCNEHFTAEIAAEMEARNYLIGQPRPTNDADFDDLDAMFSEAEASGECSEEEIRKMLTA